MGDKGSKALNRFEGRQNQTSEFVLGAEMQWQPMERGVM